jgi:hypothetical protein
MIAENNKKTFSRKKVFIENDPREYLTWCYEVSPIHFKKKFQEIGIEISGNSDLESLINLHINGNDVRGDIPDENGKPIFFNAVKVAKSIDVPKDIVTNSMKEKMKFVD